MKVPELVPLHQRDWEALTPRGRKIVAQMAEDAASATVAEAPCLKDVILAADDSELVAMPYIGPTHIKNLREWAAGTEDDD